MIKGTIARYIEKCDINMLKRIKITKKMKTKSTILKSIHCNFGKCRFHAEIFFVADLYKIYFQ